MKVKQLVLVFLAVLAAWITLAWAIWGLGVATAGLYGRGEARKQIQSAPFRIEAYQGFFNLCASIQGLEGKVDALDAQLAALQPGTREYNLTLSSLTGVKGLRREAIARYNQDALKDYTEGQFRDKDLPYQLADSDYPKGGKTKCASR